MKYQYMLVVGLIVSLGLSYLMGYTPLALGGLFALSSTVAYILYAKDKSAAVVGAWRVPEKTLHTAAVLFGWPGALVAQQRLRHKTKKRSFRVMFWFTVLINISFVAWLHCPLGNEHLRRAVYQLETLATAAVPYRAPVSALLFLTAFRTESVDWMDWIG